MNYNGHLEREIREEYRRGCKEERKRKKERVQNVKREEINSKGITNSPRMRKKGQWQTGSARCRGHQRNPAGYTHGSSPGIRLEFPGGRRGRTWASIPTVQLLKRLGIQKTTQMLLDAWLKKLASKETHVHTKTCTQMV